MRKSWVIAFLTAVGLASVGGRIAVGTQKRCEDFAQFTLPNTKITLAQTVGAGTFTPPPPPNPTSGRQASYADVPSFCRVTGDISPTPDSDIKFEVWLPVTEWNGRFQGQGNGGFAGVVDYHGMGEAVKHGYVTAGTDTGHAGGEAAWALGHPEKVIDFGYRGLHETTVKAKAIIDAFYGNHPQRSYFASCSDGGREALMEAQRFPEDYDGIMAGAPANYWTRLLLGAAWVDAATLKDEASYIPAAKLPAIAGGVLAACDAQDRVKDGLLGDPRQCQFDPTSLLCKDANSDSCLTAPQVAALKKIYAGPHDSAGRQLFSGYPRGGEEGPGGWTAWITGSEPRHSALFFFGTQYFTNMVYDQKDWDFKTLNVDQAAMLADEKTGQALNAINPDLGLFRKRGGKLILYHGWSDAAIPATSTIDYYRQVVATLGRRKVNSFVRFYLAPGMQHCGGGPGPNFFGQLANASPADPGHNMYSALEQWVEKGVAPSRFIATKYVNDTDHTKGIKMTRPLCPYPEVAKYRGTGDINDAANFVCTPGFK